MGITTKIIKEISFILEELGRMNFFILVLFWMITSFNYLEDLGMNKLLVIYVATTSLYFFSLSYIKFRFGGLKNDNKR